MNILYIAYSCNPFAGSEDKIGWCVPYESSKTNKVYVITKEEQREPVEKYLQSHPLENIKFYYVDIPNFYKKIFKGFMYSGRLNVWNRRVLPLAKKISADQKIDVIHQITPNTFCLSERNIIRIWLDLSGLSTMSFRALLIIFRWMLWAEVWRNLGTRIQIHVLM